MAHVQRTLLCASSVIALLLAGCGSNSNASDGGAGGSGGNAGTAGTGGGTGGTAGSSGSGGSAGTGGSAGSGGSAGTGGSANCGDGKVESGEACDGDTRSCTVQGHSGSQACNAKCDAYNACVSDAPPADGSPYPMSPVIAGISFDKSTLEKAAPGSDQFGYTTASDGNIYVAWGDGGGFGGTNSQGRVSLGVGRLEGTPPSWKPVNVWGGVSPESSQAATLGKTSNGVLSVGGTLYLYVDEQDVWTNNRLWKSSDLGQSWSDAGQLFNEPGSAFNDPGILQFGPDYQGARDKYVYGYDEAAFSDGLAMFRVDKANIETRSAYEFFAGMDGSGNPTWSSDISKIERVFTDPNGTNWGVTCTYDPLLKRYLLAVRHGGDSTGEWGLFDAPEPWGPWTTVGYGSDFPGWTYTPDPNGASAGRPAYIHNFPAKWMSGTTLWHISDRGDQFNIMKATLTLVGP